MNKAKIYKDIEEHFGTPSDPDRYQERDVRNALKDLENLDNQIDQ